MKKTRLGVLLLCCLLCGCGSREAEVQNIQQQYSRIQSAKMGAEITCHLEQENRSFTVECTYDKERGSTTAVVEPKELAEISATVRPDEALTVNYDGASLAAGEMTDLAPANCLPWLLRAAVEGYVLDYGEEIIEGASCLRVALDTTGENGKVLCTAWFDRQTLTPCYIEFSRDDRVVLTARMLSFTWESA
ncbi:MAG: hypothetical protein KBS74_06865 [Clostridiales bacterium]|nr:hypothetical protein [Candidatus Cacconaster stercorequi]